jgi:putative ABC transport system permease protein
MLFSEILKMALASLGANKLRAALTMIGITIGVFSVISVMTAIGALQSSIENGISFLGSNIFQFAKYPANVNVTGEIKKKYQNRRNITYREALHYSKLMEGNAREICLKSFGYEVKGQAVYNGVKTTPSLLIVGTNRSFLTANAYTLGYGRNLNDEDVDLARRVIVVGKIIEKRLFPHETPIDKVIRVSGHTYTIIGVLAEKGTSFGQSQDDICIMPITRFFEDYGEAKRTVNIATQAFSAETYNRTLDKGISAMRIARGLRANQENDFEIYSNDSLKSAFTAVAGIVRIGAFVVSFIALLAAGIGIMNIMLVSVTQINWRPQSRCSAAVSYRSSIHLGGRRDTGDCLWSDRRRPARCLVEGGHYFPVRLGDCRPSCLLGDRDRLRPLPRVSSGQPRSDRSLAIRVKTVSEH